MSKLKIDRGLIHQPVDAEGDGYRRHALTADGISPRTLPGMPGGIFSTTSDEHDPEGQRDRGPRRCEFPRCRIPRRGG